jgi:proline racemase
MIMTTIEAVDYHTAGEPFRIVQPPGTISGETVAERRIFAIGDADVQALRRFLCFEPRGHADMYGCFLVPRTTTAPISACSSGTRTASPPPVGTARSLWAPGPSTRVW